MDFNKLWQNFLDTVTNHYFDTTGRVGRAQFWYYILVVVVLDILISIVSQVVMLGALLSAAFGLALILPNIGMSVRRLQDTGMNGMLAWACLALYAALEVVAILIFISGPLGLLLAFLTIPLGLCALVAGIALIYFCAQPGQAEANAYGPPPPAWTPN